MKLNVFTALSAVALLVFSSCSNPSSPGTPAAQTVAGFTKGIITAKGSIWVNGIEYQTTGSTVHVDGVPGGDTDLKVGMVVQLNATIDPVTGKAVAQTVNYESSVKGTVDTGSIDTVAGTFAVFGQTVLVTGTTVFEGTKDLSTLAAGNFVEVSGQVDPTSITTPKTLVADRVEFKSAPGTEHFKLKGTVSSLDTTAGTFTLTLEEGQTFAVAYTGTLDPAVVNGALVRVKFTSAPVAGGLTTDAASIEVRKTELHPDEGDHTELHGVVSGYTAGATPSSPVTFTLDGQPVSSDPALFTIPAPATTLNGFRAEVDGTLTNGILVATRVHVERKDGDASLHEVKGTVASVDVNAGTFTVTKADNTTLVLTVDAGTIFHDAGWTGAAPLSKLVPDTDLVEVKYTVEGSVNTALKVERGESHPTL